MDSSTKQKIFIILGCAGITLALIILLIIVPSVKEMRDISQQIKQQLIQLEKKYEQSQHLQKTTRDIKKIQSFTPELNKIFITEGTELEFVTSLENIAQQCEVYQIIDLKIADNQQQSLSAIPITLEVRGNFTNVIKYINELEQLDYYININFLSIRPADQLKQASTLNNIPDNNMIIAHMEGSVFWQAIQ